MVGVELEAHGHPLLDLRAKLHVRDVHVHDLRVTRTQAPIIAVAECAYSLERRPSGKMLRVFWQLLESATLKKTLCGKNSIEKNSRTFIENHEATTKTHTVWLQ